MALSATAADPVPGYPTDFNTQFQIKGEVGTVLGQFKAPTEDNGYPAQALTQPVAKIVVTRSCWSISEDGVVVATFENVVPGKTLSFEDTTIPAYGYEYSYTAKSYNNDGESGWSGAYSDVLAGVQVKQPEIVSVATSDKGLAPLTFTIRCEALDTDGEALEWPLTALTLTYETGDDDDAMTQNVVAKIENPEAGKDYTVTLTEATEGATYTFNLVSECKFGRSDKATKEVYIGEDIPGQVVDLTAIVKGGGALVIWNAPEVGKHNGWLDPQNLRYKVERVINYDATLLADNLTGCEYEDPCDDLTKITSIEYRVTPYNTIGEGQYANSEAVVVGPAATLPFIEHFNSPKSPYGVVSDNLWTEEPEEYDWDYSTMTYYSGGFTGVLAEEGGEEGYAYINKTSAYSDSEHRIVSTPIDLTNAKNPVLSFWYLTKPGYDNVLKVAMRVDKEETEVLEVRIGDPVTRDGEGSEWTQRSIEIPQFAGKKASIVFNSVYKNGGNYAPVCIDEVALEDKPTQTGIQNIGVGAEMTEYYDLTGMRRSSFSEGEIIIKRVITADGKVNVKKVRM